MHLLYCSVQSLGGNVNTRRMSQPDMESIFLIQNQGIILVIGNYYVNYQNYQIIKIICFYPPRILLGCQHYTIKTAVHFKIVNKATGVPQFLVLLLSKMGVPYAYVSYAQNQRM